MTIFEGFVLYFNCNPSSISRFLKKVIDKECGKPCLATGDDEMIVAKHDNDPWLVPKSTEYSFNIFFMETFTVFK